MTKSRTIRETMNPNSLLAVPLPIALQDFGPAATDFDILRHAERALAIARNIQVFSDPELVEWVDHWNPPNSDPQLTQKSVLLLQSAGAACFAYAEKAYQRFRGQAHCGHYTEAFAAVFPEAAA